MSRAMVELPAIAIMAKAPIAGFAKTRLIPALGAQGAADLQARLIEHTVRIASGAGLGPVLLWCAPDTAHPLFAHMRARFGIGLAKQPDGDLGARILAAVSAAPQSVLVIGTDCPVLSARHLRDAAHALESHDAVVIPADDGGYVLIGTRTPQPALFAGVTWSTATVMAETRARLRECNMTWAELPPLWDIDTPDDLARMKREGLAF